MDYVRIEIDERVATVTFDRPPVNALDAQAFREIGQAFRSLGEGTDAHVAIFTAPGTRVFCAGVDLPGLGSAPEPPAHRRRHHHRRTRSRCRSS